MSAAKHLAMIERRVTYLVEQRNTNPLAVAELESLRWALPYLRPVAAREAPRAEVAGACGCCKASF